MRLKKYDRLMPCPLPLPIPPEVSPLVPTKRLLSRKAGGQFL